MEKKTYGADVCGAVESLQDFRVEFQNEVLLLGNLYIPVRYCIANPIGKRSSDDRIGEVQYPLPRNLVHVSVIWQILHH